MAFRRKLYDPASPEPFGVSRSKIDLYVQCPRCFWLDSRAGVKRPSMPAFSLNNAVDALLKREFDAHREAGTPHPYMVEHGINAVPLKHPRMDEWRDALKRGVTTVYEPANLLVRGGVDDIWIDPEGQFIVVDYKATATLSEITLDGPWKVGYKRQMEIYQWLLRQNGFPVHPRGYFVYLNGALDRDALDGKLEFGVQLIPYEGDDAWIPGTLKAMKACLDGELPPPSGETCEHCAFVADASRY